METLKKKNRRTYEEEMKIEEGFTLLVKREIDGERIFKYWACNEYGHFASECPKRVKKYIGNFQYRKPRNYLYANDDEDESEENSESDDELGFVSIKEESPKKE